MSPNEIPPALTPDEWKRRAMGQRPLVEAELGTVGENDEHTLYITDDLNAFGADNLPGLIALANAALPDTDPRKITRHHVWIVRTLADHVDTQHPGGIRFRREALELAAVLESYLPPETP
jgi:hypothetical protein